MWTSLLIQTFDHSHFDWWEWCQCHPVSQSAWNILQFHWCLCLWKKKKKLQMRLTTAYVQRLSLNWTVNWTKRLTPVHNHEVWLAVFVDFPDSSQKKANACILKRRESNCKEEVTQAKFTVIWTLLPATQELSITAGSPNWKCNCGFKVLLVSKWYNLKPTNMTVPENKLSFLWGKVKEL